MKWIGSVSIVRMSLTRTSNWWRLVPNACIKYQSSSAMGSSDSNARNGFIHQSRTEVGWCKRDLNWRLVRRSRVTKLAGRYYRSAWLMGAGFDALKTDLCTADHPQRRTTISLSPPLLCPPPARILARRTPAQSTAALWQILWSVTSRNAMNGWQSCAVSEYYI